MKNCFLFCILLLSFSVIKCQKPTETAGIKGLDIFILGDSIVEYQNKLTAAPLKTSKPTADRYKYSGKEITSYLGYKITGIILEFCSGKLESVMYRFDDANPRSKELFTREQLEPLMNKLIKQFGKVRMHNSNSMEPDEKGGGGLDSENWSWTSKTSMMSLMWMKTGYSSNKDFVSLSVIDRELREKCKSK